MTLLNKKVLAASAAAIMLLPFAASAHEGGLNVGAFIGQGIVHANVNANVGNKNADNDNDGAGVKVHATSTVAVKNASTTAAVLTKKATRINNAADFLASLSPNLSARIASSSLSASSTAAANAQLSDYNTNLANTKTQANAALTAAGDINAANSTTTNSGFATTAQADLTAARSFLKAAQKDLMQILHAIFNA